VRSWLGPLAVALLMTAALAACGGSSATHAAATANGKGATRPYVDFYAGLPLGGPLAKDGQAVLNGIELAKQNSHPHTGAPPINFIHLNDSGRKTAKGNQRRVIANAVKVSTDPHAVYYIGDLSSAATSVTLPIMNAAGIAQITPGDPYIAPALASKQLLLLQPPNRIQAGADMKFFQQIVPLKLSKCAHVMALSEDNAASKQLVAAMAPYAKADGIAAMPTLATPTTKTLTTKTLTNFEAELHNESPALCGFVIAGGSVPLAVALTKTVHTEFRNALIVGTSGLCGANSRWAKASTRGLSAVPAQLLWCTSPQWPLDQYLDATEFSKLYRQTYGSTGLGPYALYGYWAWNLGVAMMNFLDAGGENRGTVRTSLYDPDLRALVQRYAELATRESSLTSYALYRISPKTAKPVYDSTLKP
jgi:branched-chain amino acid transport system substrate-binding protein